MCADWGSHPNSKIYRLFLKSLQKMLSAKVLGWMGNVPKPLQLYKKASKLSWAIGTFAIQNYIFESWNTQWSASRKKAFRLLKCKKWDLLKPVTKLNLGWF